MPPVHGRRMGRRSGLSPPPPLRLDHDDLVDEAAARNAAASVGPASTITRVMPSVASRRSTVARSRSLLQPRQLDLEGAPPPPDCRATPSPRRSARPGHRHSRSSPVCSVPAAGQRCRAQCVSACVRRRWQSGAAGPGSSASTVPMPVRTASAWARSRWTSARAESPVTNCGWPRRERGPAMAIDGDLQLHERPSLGDPQDVPERQPARLRRQGAERHLDACRPQPVDAVAGDTLVGVADGNDGAADAGGDDDIGAGGAAADMRTGFEGDVNGAAARRAAGLLSATNSACGRPPACVKPRPTISPLPARTTTAPTDGLGAAPPRPRSPSRSASAMNKASVIVRPLVMLTPTFRRRFFGCLGLRAGEFLQHFGEITRLAEVAVDRGKPDIGDTVDRAQRVHDEAADLARSDLFVAGAFETADDAGNEPLDAFGLDRALAAAPRKPSAAACRDRTAPCGPNA